MMILVSYDVATYDSAGARRLRKAAKCCEAVGVRVQNSVFECLVEPAQYVVLKAKLEQIIDKEQDSVRFYRLGSNWKSRVETLGKARAFEQEDVLIL